MVKLMLKPQSLTSIDRTCLFFLNSFLLVKTLCSRVLMVKCQFLDCFFGESHVCFTRVLGQKYHVLYPCLPSSHHTWRIL